MIVIRREYLRQRAVLITILLCVILPLCLRIIYNYKYEFVVLRGKIKANPSFRPLREVLAVDASLKKRHNSELEPLVVIYNAFFASADWYSTLGTRWKAQRLQGPLEIVRQSVSSHQIRICFSLQTLCLLSSLDISNKVVSLCT